MADNYLTRTEYVAAHGEVERRLCVLEQDVYSREGLLSAMAANTTQTKHNTVMLRWVLVGVIGVFMTMIVNLWGKYNVGSHLEQVQDGTTGDLWTPDGSRLDWALPGVALAVELEELLVYSDWQLPGGTGTEPEVRQGVLGEGRAGPQWDSDSSRELRRLNGPRLEDAQQGVYSAWEASRNAWWAGGSPLVTGGGE